MLLQPLVDNAIHYGMRTSPGRLVIAVTGALLLAAKRDVWDDMKTLMAKMGVTL